jgi:hypothetical protein
MLLHLGLFFLPPERRGYDAASFLISQSQRRTLLGAEVPISHRRDHGEYQEFGDKPCIEFRELIIVWI